VLFSIGLILGFGYFIPHITEPQALFLTTGTAAQAVVAVGLVMLPQKLSQDKAEGRLDYVMTLPVSREAYVLAQVLFVAILSLPATALAVAFGAWHYNLSLAVEPAVLLVAVLAVLSLAGVGVAMAVLSPYPQLTNMLTQLIIFYVLLFAPVLFPKEYLPSLLRHVSVYLPPTYVADGLRGSLTDLPGTHLARSMLVMFGFAIASIGLSAAVIRRRG
jgi:ABC-2 type transport system permease protein